MLHFYSGGGDVSPASAQYLRSGYFSYPSTESNAVHFFEGPKGGDFPDVSE